MPITETTIFKNFGAKIKKTESDGEIVARVTTACVDREGDVVLPGGIDMAGFAGTMLLNHDQSQLPIGKWVAAEKKGSGIIMRGSLTKRPPEHPPMVEWVPDTIKWLIQQDVLSGVSIGFQIKNARPPNTKDQERYPGAQRVINEWNLIECSIVPVPCNPEAIITAVGKSAQKDSILIKLWGIVADKPVLEFTREAIELA